jgi:hypothetical protein
MLFRCNGPQRIPLVIRAAHRASAAARNGHFVGLKRQLAVFFIVALLAQFSTGFLALTWARGFPVASAIYWQRVSSSGVLLKNGDSTNNGLMLVPVAEPAKTLT